MAEPVTQPKANANGCHVVLVFDPGHRRYAEASVQAVHLEVVLVHL